ncbi:MAG: UbiA family prenyltransferase [Planctomycetota bacterium]
MNVRALLELCRISNLPTVWSNAFIGLFAGVYAGYIAPEDGSPRDLSADQLIQGISRNPLEFALVTLAVILPFSLLYMGGMVLNDVVDHAVDAQERPARPIPSGRISIRAASRLARARLVIGFLSIVLLEWLFTSAQSVPFLATALAGALVISIVLYNAIHQRSAMAVLLMSACRSLLILTAATLISAPVAEMDRILFFAGPAATVFVYTLLISIVARNEMQPRWFGGPKTIMNMIAAMPLLDAAWLVAMGLWPASVFCIACAGMTKLAHRKVAGS